MPEFDYTPEEFENLVNNVYLGNVSPDSLPLDLYNAINGYLSAGLDLVFGENIVFDVGAPDLKLYQYFKHNVAVFSGAKTYQQARDMSELVFSPDGFKRSFTDFKKDAKKVFDTYNKNWLRTEYDTAVTSAQTATQWNQITEDAEALPYLKYVTAGDERVRHDHRAWNGITLPVNHKFWNTHYPPNGWNCRCMVVQLDDNDRVRITPDKTLDIVPPPDSELFNNNPAKTGVIFDKSHPYFNFKKEHQARASRNFGLPTPEKPAEAIKPQVEKPKVKRAKTLEQAEANELEFIKTLKDNEKRALFEYTNSTYNEINGYLRGRAEMQYLGNEKAFLNLVKDLEDTLEKSPKFEGLTHRLIKFNDRGKFDAFMKNINSGGVFVEKGFMSTSTEDLSRFMDGKYRVKMEVEGKNGVLIKEMSINPDENEILFNKGTAFEVKEVVKKYDYDFEEQAEYIIKLKEV